MQALSRFRGLAHSKSFGPQPLVPGGSFSLQLEQLVLQSVDARLVDFSRLYSAFFAVTDRKIFKLPNLFSEVADLRGNC